MSLEARIVGQRGCLEGDPLLRGHWGRIPYDVAAAAGKATLTEGGAAAALIEFGASASLTEGGATATPSEGGTTAALTEGGAMMTLTEEFC